MCKFWYFLLHKTKGCRIAHVSNFSGNWVRSELKAEFDVAGFLLDYRLLFDSTAFGPVSISAMPSPCFPLASWDSLEKFGRYVRQEPQKWSGTLNANVGGNVETMGEGQMIELGKKWGMRRRKNVKEEASVSTETSFILEDFKRKFKKFQSTGRS